MSDLRTDALEVLRGWRAPDAAQERLRTEYVRHLEAHDDAMRRTCFPAHLTAGALVVSEDVQHVLLTLHAKARQWFQFGGHTEPEDTTLAGAAHREAEEESGISGLRLDPVPLHLDRHEVAFCDPRGPVHHLDVRFLAVAPHGAEHEVSEESLDVRWWPVDALPTSDLGDLVAAAVQRASTSSATI